MSKRNGDLRGRLLLTSSLAVERWEIDISTETFIGRPSTKSTEIPTTSTRFAIAPLANFPVLSCKQIKEPK